MVRTQEKVWATVTPEILAKIEAIRDDVESSTWIRPSIGQVVLSLVKQALDARAIAPNNQAQHTG